jgi:signal peptidase I
MADRSDEDEDRLFGEAVPPDAMPDVTPPEDETPPAWEPTAAADEEPFWPVPPAAAGSSGAQSLHAQSWPDGSGPGSWDDEPDPARPSRRTQDNELTAEPAGGGSFLRELPVLLLVAFVLAFLLRTFVLQVFFIPSSSMEETLRIDDRMVVEKVTYRFREPIRGEIVVFEGDSGPVAAVELSPGARVVRGLGQFLGVVPASARDFVKRVIGLAGDEVLIEGGRVFINGQLLDEPYVVYDDLSDHGPVTVPEGHLFFLGDNRPNSSDSRRGLGMVPRDQVVGRAAVIIWPLGHIGRLTDVEHDVPEPERSAPR